MARTRNKQDKQRSGRSASRTPDRALETNKGARPDSRSQRGGRDVEPKGFKHRGPETRPEGVASSQRHDHSGPALPALKPSARRGFFLYGRNSVEAALLNSNRECLRIIGTEKALANKHLLDIRPNLRVEMAPTLEVLSEAVPLGAPHQGLLLEVLPLPTVHLENLQPIPGEANIILMLDQVTDPHNVGACIRSAAAFGARAVISQDRNSPFEGGVVARAAAGGLEALPWLHVPNLSGALDKLRGMGYWHVGLDGNTKMSIRDVSLGDNIVIVMGSEGSGLRPLVKKNCDVIAKIPMTGDIESLNVSNAAAIALYELTET
jgi:23S rRNA (guanosine2251-2'-O)-methyltransferase